MDNCESIHGMFLSYWQDMNKIILNINWVKCAMNREVINIHKANSKHLWRKYFLTTLPFPVFAIPSFWIDHALNNLWMRSINILKLFILGLLNHKLYYFLLISMQAKERIKRTHPKISSLFCEVTQLQEWIKRSHQRCLLSFPLNQW